MKKILFGAFAFVFFIACNNKEEKKDTSANSTSTATAETKKTPDELLSMS